MPTEKSPALSDAEQERALALYEGGMSGRAVARALRRSDQAVRALLLRTGKLRRSKASRVREIFKTNPNATVEAVAREVGLAPHRVRSLLTHPLATTAPGAKAAAIKALLATCSDYGEIARRAGTSPCYVSQIAVKLGMRVEHGARDACMRRMRAAGVPVAEIAREFKLSKKYVRSLTATPRPQIDRRPLFLQVVASLKDKAFYADVAREVGCARSTAALWAKEMGLSHKFGLARQERAIRLLRAGLTPRQAAEQVGFSAAHVRALRAREGIKSIGRWANEDEERHDRAAQKKYHARNGQRFWTRDYRDWLAARSVPGFKFKRATWDVYYSLWKKKTEAYFDNL